MKKVQNYYDGKIYILIYGIEANLPIISDPLDKLG